VKRFPDELVNPGAESRNAFLLLAQEEDGDVLRVRVRAKDLDEAIRPEPRNGEIEEEDVGPPEERFRECLAAVRSVDDLVSLPAEKLVKGPAGFLRRVGDQDLFCGRRGCHRVPVREGID
jgi:hypothetical protein